MNFDRWILAAASLVLSICILLLVDDRILFRVGPPSFNPDPIAKVSRLDHDVRRKYRDDFAYFSVDTEDLVYQADSIFTGSESEAEILFTNGTKINVDADSLVVISNENGAISLNLKIGTLAARIRGKTQVIFNAGEKPREVLSSDAQISLSNGEQGSTHLTVLAGKIELPRVNSRPTVVQKNQAVEISHQGKISPVRTFAVEPLVPAENSVVRSRSDHGGVKFQWAVSQKAHRYQFEISRLPDLSEPLFRAEETQNQRVVKNLPYEGVVFWRVTSLAADGKVVGSSAIRRVTLLSQKPPTLHWPEESANFVALTKEDRDDTRSAPILLKWSLEASAGNKLIGDESAPKDLEDTSKEYRVQIARDSDFHSIVKEKVVSETTLLLNPLAPGKYHWRVGTSAVPWSSSRSFVIEAREKSWEPEVVSSSNKSRVLLNRGKAEIELAWRTSPSSKAYRIQVSKTEQFSNADVVINDKISDPVYKSTLTKVGSYYWRVQSIQKNGVVTRFSTPRRIEVLHKPPLSAPIVPGAPIEFEMEKRPDQRKQNQARSQIMRFGAIAFIRLVSLFIPNVLAGEKCPSLKWTANEAAKKYKLQISADTSFAQPILNIDVENNSYCWEDYKLGNYYWRVSAIDSDGEIGEVSRVAEVHIRPPPIDKKSLSEKAIEPEVGKASKKEPVKQAKTAPEKSDWLPANNPFQHIVIESKSPRTYEVRAGLGLASLSYSETGISSFSAVLLLGRLNLQKQLWSKSWHVQLEGWASLLSLGSSPEKFWLYGGDLSLGYRLFEKKSRLAFTFNVGAFYQSSHVSNNFFGYQSLLGPEVFPVLSYRFNEKNKFFLAAKYQPILDNPTGANSNRLIVVDLGVRHRTKSSRRRWEFILRYSSVAIDFSDILFISSSSLGLMTSVIF